MIRNLLNPPSTYHTLSHLASSDILSQTLPPPADAHIGGPCEPGVKDINAAQAVRSPDRVP